jgi:ATP-dependent Clp protease protease subunit
MGLSASIAALLLAGGALGKRFSLPNSRMLIHQPWTQASRPLQASDLEIEAREILRTRNQVNSIIAQHTGQEFAKIERDSERDFWMDPIEAKDYGLIDDVLPSAIKTPETDGVTSG